MFVLVLAAEADETRQAITFLIVCLVGIAVMLSLLTTWYWRFTSPKRRARSSAPVVPEAEAETEGSTPASISAVAPAPATVEIDRLPLGPALATGPGRPRIEVPDRSAGRPSVAARIEVVERCNKRSGAGRGRTRLEPLPAAVGADSHHRNGSRDGRPQGRVSSDAGSAVLSDDDWASVMRSAFDKMQR